MSKFFIRRPIFAIVVSLIIVLLGLISLVSLPIAQYPQISPPTINLSASYTGANAETVNQTVAQVLENQLNGIEGMDYMSSTSSNNGSYSLSIVFNLDTDGNTDSVNVQNTANLAKNGLPSEVQQTGLSVRKSSGDMALMVNLYSPNNTYDTAFLKNYADIYLLDKLKRVSGVGNVNAFGSTYAMRVWLNPDKLAERGLTVSDVTSAIKEQNQAAPAGTVGAPPTPKSGEAVQCEGGGPSFHAGAVWKYHHQVGKRWSVRPSPRCGRGRNRRAELFGGLKARRQDRGRLWRTADE